MLSASLDLTSKDYFYELYEILKDRNNHQDIEILMSEQHYTFLMRENELQCRLKTMTERPKPGPFFKVEFIRLRSFIFSTYYHLRFPDLHLLISIVFDKGHEIVEVTRRQQQVSLKIAKKDRF